MSSWLPARAAMAVTRTIPIVFVAGDPVAHGLVASEARPGGNVTGLAVPSEAAIARQRLAVLTRTAPRPGPVAVLANPGNAANEDTLAHLLGASAPAMSLHPFRTRSAEEVEQAGVALQRAGVGGLLVLPDPLFTAHASRIVELAAAGALPAVYGARAFVEAGGLMALHGNTAEVLRRTAALVGRVLGGAAPATLPVGHLTHLELALNLETARRLGLRVPRSLLARADTLIGS
jgi:putative tryptophan/tyrosine transport system substrate-binding protein